MVHVLCTDRNHPVYRLLFIWCIARGYSLFNSDKDLTGGDTLFLISCTKVIKRHIRDRYRKVWVIHESDLPSGRGWSPLAWQILEGRNEFVVSLIEAADEVDTGGILEKASFRLDGHELADEIQEKLFFVKAGLMDHAIKHSNEALIEQPDSRVSYYPKRTPEDSELDPAESIESQFDKLRICEPRFPAFFRFRDHKYEVSIKKI